MAAILSSILSYLFPVQRGQAEDYPLPLRAVPGLTSVLDVALYRSVEGQLTATICSTHSLLSCWLDVKHQSQLVLDLLKEEEDENTYKASYESFARQCLESSCDAIERLSTDRLANAANLSDPYDSTSSASHGYSGGGGGGGGGGYSGGFYHNATVMSSGVGVQGVASGILESKNETGRRRPMQSRRDCWESPRLYCPDYVWADDAYNACQRWVRTLDRHPFMTTTNRSSTTAVVDTLTATSGTGGGGGGGKHTKGGGGGGSGGVGTSNASSFSSNLMPETERQTAILVQLVRDDIPVRLYQFRQATEADVVVTKRLYLVKSEYRVPFRTFLEAHQMLLRTPPIELVDYYLDQRSNDSRKNDTSELDGLKARLQSLLSTPGLIEMLALEKKGEEIELALGEALFPFSELARTLDHKKARLKVVPGVVTYDELPTIQECVRRLKYILCRKAGSSETSTGIRPILLDLRLVPRDDQPKESSFLGKMTLDGSSGSYPYSSSSTLEERVDVFISQLTTLSTLVKTKNAFAITRTSGHASPDTIEFSLPVVKGCIDDYDPDLLKCQLLDWFAIVDRQHELQEAHEDLPDEIRRAEMKMSIAGASAQSLQMVKERLMSIQLDREQRFEVLKEMVEEVCLREMNLYVQLTKPDPQEALELKEISAKGFLGVPLEIAGEPLPLG